MTETSALEAVLRRDRWIVLGGLAGITALAWAYLVAMAIGMGDMPMAMGEAMMTVEVAPWGALDFALMFLMWAIMMVGMMVPSAAPMILLFAKVSRQRTERAGPFTPTGAFVAGYVAVWTGFSLTATGLQWALEQAALLSPMMMASTSPLLGGGLLVLAGLYQWTPLKDVCLRHCRSPLHFLLHGWLRGVGGAFRMGLEHGAYCVGCCWVLMGLLFVAGVMNLLWVAAIAGFVLLEKVAPAGARLGRLSGLLLVAAGVFVMLRP
jgi:predicted metal-binding membrane protein